MTKRHTTIPGESSIPGLGIPGYMIPGMEYLAAINQAITVRVHNTTMQRIAEVPLYTSLNITENWYTPNTWELIVNRYLPGVVDDAGNPLIDLGNYISVVQDTITSQTPFVGMIERYEPAMTVGGKHTELWTVGGRCAKGGKLKKRRCMNHFSEAATGGKFIQSSVAYETAMRAIVNENAIAAIGVSGAADANRNITGLSLAAVDSLAGGTATELVTRGDKLLDVLETWSKASGLNCSLDWDGVGNNFTFNVNQGVDRSGAGTEKKVILSVDYRNVTSYKYMNSILESADTLYCCGSGNEDARLMELVYSGAEPTGENRNEEFVDLSDCTTSDQLITKGLEQLVQFQPTETLTFDYDITSSSYVLDRDFFCGDTIVVEFPGVVTMTSRIISINKTWEKDGYNVKITMGTEKPDLVSIVKKLKFETSSIRRH